MMGSLGQHTHFFLSRNSLFVRLNAGLRFHTVVISFQNSALAAAGAVYAMHKTVRDFRGGDDDDVFLGLSFVWIGWQKRTFRRSLLSPSAFKAEVTMPPENNLHFSSEDGNSTLLRNIGFYQPVHTKLKPRKS
jgi:hypothetical protein